MTTCTGCSTCPLHFPKTQAIYGKTQLQNGLILPWLKFIDASLSLTDAQNEAMRLESCAWKGVIVKTWIV